MPSLPASQPRARGAVRLGTKALGAATVIDDLRMQGSLKLLFPRPSSNALSSVLVNTAGGITGGDAFAVSLRAARDTRLRVTTQAAERAYRAQPTEHGRLATTIKVDAGARLDWLPQETILFDGCALDRRLIADLSEDSAFLMVEPLVFGRAAMAETLRNAAFRDRVEIRRGGTLVFADRIALQGDVAARLARPSTAAGAGAMVSLVYVAPDAEVWLNRLRADLPETAGVSLVRDGVLFLRGLASDSHALRTWLVPMLDRLTDGDLPRPWMI
ncbi:MAG: urease accessory protein UreD [Paracoccaceae bacterium]